ncbi:MAG: class I SAM-dependent methyltransferase [Dehalococcoidia bacterium]|nr:class I SAM-dependent methyltransferase [Dehalococcoidia bacterium]
MRRQLLELIRCPYCETGLSVSEVFEEQDGEVLRGLVKCECSEFAILEGILNLKADHVAEYFRRLVKEGRQREALGLSLGRYADTLAESVCRVATALESNGTYYGVLGKTMLGLLKARARHEYKRRTSKGATFYSLMGGGGYQTYLKHRFSSPTFWSLYAYVPVLKQKRERILDLCCGTGHASFVISACVEPRELVCADNMFGSLYAARKYFAPQAQFVCLDANCPLPFRDGVFTSVLMLDAFHLVQARASLAHEMERILSAQGLLLVPHLHNSLKYNPSAGKPLTPSGWAGLFHRLAVKGIPEAALVEDFMLRDRLDLTRDYPEDEMDSSDAVHLVGSADSTLLKVFEEVSREFLSQRRNPVINPTYQIDRRQGEVILRRQFPSESFRKEYPLAEKHLPEECSLSGGLAEVVTGTSLSASIDRLSEEDSRKLEDLMRKFVVVNVPEGYC